MTARNAGLKFWGTLILAAVGLILMALALGMADSCRDGFAAAEIRKNAAAGCGEFWFNRYQTLLTGILALISAVVGAYLVWHQLRAMQSGQALTIQQAAGERASALDAFPLFALRVDEIASRMEAAGKAVMDARAADMLLKAFQRMSDGLKELSDLIVDIEATANTFRSGPVPSAAIKVASHEIRQIDASLRAIVDATAAEVINRNLASAAGGYVVAPMPEVLVAIFGALGEQYRSKATELRAYKASIEAIAGSERGRLFRLMLGLEKHWQI